MIVHSSTYQGTASSVSNEKAANCSEELDKDFSSVIDLSGLFSPLLSECQNDSPPSTILLEPFLKQVEHLHLDYVESWLNVQGNYNNYVCRSLKSISEVRKLNFKEALDEITLHITDEPRMLNTRKTLVLDLDETLIHADFEGMFDNPDHLVTFTHENCEVTVPIFLRPGLLSFLTEASQHYEIIVFTASKKEYADAVLNFLDPENKFFKSRFYRDSCICIKGKVFIKDLRIFSNIRHESTIIVDNSMYSFTNQISNGVLINSFYNDNNDRELYNVLNYLMNYLLLSQDVRTVNEQVFNFSSIVEGFSKNKMS